MLLFCIILLEIPRYGNSKVKTVQGFNAFGFAGTLVFILYHSKQDYKSVPTIVQKVQCNAMLSLHTIQYNFFL